MTLSEELQWRGFVKQTTFKQLTDLDQQPYTFYWGVDPSADSMTIGNLAAAMMVRTFMAHGHKAILLVGGATGMIGDPDGKKQERDLLTLEDIARNKAGISAQYRTVFDGMQFEIVDNYDWFQGLGYLGFLRDIGKHTSMTQMLDREFVQSRIGEGGDGLSYAEFSYALIQGYDFLHLYRQHGATLQICGADQWGNSITGVELIRRIEGAEAHVYSCPLIVNKTTGVKFGKSEAGAVWLDEAKTSVYQFYQFWLNVDDLGVIDYLKVYTLLGPDDIEQLQAASAENPGARIAQKRLAYEVTKIVHGADKADAVERMTKTLFGGDYGQLTAADFDELAKSLPVVTGGEQPLVDILVPHLASSKGEARRFIESGAVYVNNVKVGADKATLTADDMLHSSALVRRGKNQQILYRFVAE